MTRSNRRMGDAVVFQVVFPVSRVAQRRTNVRTILREYRATRRALHATARSALNVNTAAAFSASALHHASKRSGSAFAAIAPRTVRTSLTKTPQALDQ